MDLEKSRTVKRRLRRERIAMEKRGDFIAFKPNSTPIKQSDDQPKMTNHAKRAARKRRKIAAWKQDVEDICSGVSSNPTVVLKETKEHDISKSKKSRLNQHKKFIEEELAIDNDNEASSVNTEITQESSGLNGSDVVDGSIENNEINEEKAEPNGLSKEAKKDLPHKKRRYVLFVGNLSYETKEEDVLEHFKKIGSITSVRIAKHKDGNNCRGFCHLEVGDEETYLKALSLHHTFMAKRRINVEYSCGQTEEKGDVKRKNFKLQTLNKTGRLGVSNFRRNQSGNKVKSKPAKEVRKAFFV